MIPDSGRARWQIQRATSCKFRNRFAGRPSSAPHYQPSGMEWNGVCVGS